MPNTVNKLPQEDTAKVRQKEELMQLFDSLDERRQRLVLVHIRALAGKGVTRLKRRFHLKGATKNLHPVI